MTITQLLTDLAVIGGILLFAALAVVPIMLEREAEKADRPASTPRPRPTSPVSPLGSRGAQARFTASAAQHLPHAA